MTGAESGRPLSPRPFWLVRDGRRIGAEGVVWSTGQIAVNWAGTPMSLSSWAELEGLLAGDGGSVEIQWAHWQEDHSECVEYYDGAVWIR